MRYLITGATGLLGRNVLYEILRREGVSPPQPEIVLLVRPGRQGEPFAERVRCLFEQDGQDVLAHLDIEHLDDVAQLGIECIEANLDEDGLGLPEESVKKITSRPIDVVHHIAARLDFRRTDQVRVKLERTNVRATEELLNVLSHGHVGELCFVSSAYVCGMTTGPIEPDYINFDQDFRNPYEKTKLQAEVLVRDYCDKNGIRCRVFRPSTISGNLMTAPIGFTPKFDVFYGWGLFFLRTKFQMLQDWDQLFETPVNIDCRICYRTDSGLNVVSADYAAKVICEACTQAADGDSFHLVNNEETPHELYTTALLDTMKVQGVTQVDHIPEDLNFVENIYYNKSVGHLYTPYITMQPMLFSVENLRPVLARAGFDCPPVDKDNFATLMAFARERKFGLEELLARQKAKAAGK